MARLFFPCSGKRVQPLQAAGRALARTRGTQGSPARAPRSFANFLGFDFTRNGAPWVKAQPLRVPGEAWLGHWECRINHSCDSDMA